MDLGTKDQGPRTKDQGSRIKDQGPRTKDHGPRSKDQVLVPVLVLVLVPVVGLVLVLVLVLYSTVWSPAQTGPGGQNLAFQRFEPIILRSFLWRFRKTTLEKHSSRQMTVYEQITFFIKKHFFQTFF